MTASANNTSLKEEGLSGWEGGTFLLIRQGNQSGKDAEYPAALCLLAGGRAQQDSPQGQSMLRDEEGNIPGAEAVEGVSSWSQTHGVRAGGSIGAKHHCHCRGRLNAASPA